MREGGREGETERERGERGGREGRERQKEGEEGEEGERDGSREKREGGEGRPHIHIHKYSRNTQTCKEEFGLMSPMKTNIVFVPASARVEPGSFCHCKATFSRLLNFAA